MLYEAAQEIMGKPVAAAMSEATGKIRRNLLAVSCLTIAVVILGVRVAQANTLLGISFEGLTADTLKKGLLAVNVYMLVHFLWCMFDELQEWRLRVTGTRSAFITGSAPTVGESSKYADYPTEPHQSTLYNWWKAAAPRFPVTQEAVDGLEGALNTALHSDDIKSVGITDHLPGGIALHQVLGTLEEIKKEMEVTRGVMENPRVLASLARFDNAYELFMRSQNLRWLVIEAGFPVLLGLASLGVLIRDLCCLP